jgi:hypothetical protein
MYSVMLRSATGSEPKEDDGVTGPAANVAHNAATVAIA